MLLVFALSAVTTFLALEFGGNVGATHASEGVPTVEMVDASQALIGLKTIRGSKRGRVPAADILVLYNLSSPAKLLLLRRTLGLDGYSAAMSRFYCGSLPGVPSRPIDVAILSRQPVEEVIEYDAPAAHCAAAGAFTDGPGVPVLRMASLSRKGWPDVAELGGRPMPGPGFLAILSGKNLLVALAMPAIDDYPIDEEGPVTRMKVALGNAARDWSRAQQKLHLNSRIVIADPDRLKSFGVLQTAMR